MSTEKHPWRGVRLFFALLLLDLYMTLAVSPKYVLGLLLGLLSLPVILPLVAITTTVQTQTDTIYWTTERYDELVPAWIMLAFDALLLEDASVRRSRGGTCAICGRLTTGGNCVDRDGVEWPSCCPRAACAEELQRRREVATEWNKPK